MPSYPNRGTEPWDNSLKDYIDGSVGPAAVAAVAASPTVANAAAAAVAGVVAGQKITLWNKMPILFLNYFNNPTARDSTAGWGPNSALIETSTTRVRPGGSATSVKVTANAPNGSGVYTVFGTALNGKTFVQQTWVYPEVKDMTIRAEVNGVYAETFTCPAYKWTLVWGTGSQATNAAGTNPTFYAYNAEVGDVFYLNGLMVVDGSAPVAYFDGDSRGCYWTGTAHASTSIKAAYAKDEVLDAYRMPVLARNLISRGTFATGIDPWVGDGGQVSVVSGRAHVVGATTGTYAVFTCYDQIPLDVGAQVTARARIRQNGSTEAIFRLTPISLAGEAQYGQAIEQHVSGTDEVATLRYTCPAGIRSIRVDGYHFVNAPGEWFEIDEVMVAPGLGEPPAFFQGDSLGCRWVGDPYASPSVRLLPTRDQTLINAPELERNLAPSPNLATDWFLWQHTNTREPGGVAVMTNTGSDGYMAMSGIGQSRATVSGSKQYTFQVEGLAASVARPFVTYVTWYDKTGASLGTITAPGIYDKVGEWTPMIFTLTSPVGATAVTSEIGFYQTAVGEVHKLRRYAVVDGTRPLSSWFDGDTPGCRWLGTRGLSQSVKTLESKADHDMLLWLDAGRAQGTGSPEGRVPAPVGTRYVDTKGAVADGGTGAIEWIKAGGGAGATGWRVTYGDTQLRGVNNLLVPTVVKPETATTLIRMGDQVTFGVTGLGTAPAFVPYFTAPAGFAAQAGAGVARTTFREYVASGVTVNHYVSGSEVYPETYPDPAPNWRWQGYIQWTTRDQWPTALPGTPV